MALAISKRIIILDDYAKHVLCAARTLSLCKSHTLYLTDHIIYQSNAEGSHFKYISLYLFLYLYKQVNDFQPHDVL